MTNWQRVSFVTLFVCIFGLAILAVVSADGASRPSYRNGGEEYKDEKQGEKAVESFWQKTADDPVAAFTGVLVVFTAVLAAVSAIQIHFLSNADKTAGRSADTAERALRDLERPYLFVEVDPRISAEMRGEARVAFATFSLMNYGRFPADITDCRADVTQSESPVDPGPVGTRDDFFFVVAPAENIQRLHVPLAFFTELRFYNNANGEIEGAFPVRTRRTTFFRIDLTYRGMGEVTYTSNYVWRWDHAPERWVRHTRFRT